MDAAALPPALPLAPLHRDPAARGLARFAWTALACALTTAVALALRGWLDPVNLVMLYLLAVVLVTVRYGRAAGVTGSFLSVLAFDVFLVPPYYSISVNDSEYLLTFAVMLIVALITSQLTASLRQQAWIASVRERRAQALFALSHELSGALTREQIDDIGTRHMRTLFQADAFLLFGDGEGRLRPAPGAAASPGEILTAAQRMFACLADEQVGAHGLTLAGVVYLPLRAPVRPRGILVLAPPHGLSLPPDQVQLLQAAVAQIALAAERVHYVEVAQASSVEMASERLRNSLLSALSHDLRTPLTAIIGMASTLAERRALPAGAQEDLARAIHDNARRMSELVSNLLDMARLRAGPVALNRQWQMLEEVVGSALAYLAPALQGTEVRVSLAADLPLVEFDAVLIERVLCNLLDNALKYAPQGRVIRIGAQRAGASIEVAVEDEGAGVPAGMEEAIFRKFARARPESAEPGIGLGLSICQAIVEAHDGSIRVERGAAGGARFVFALPAGKPPPLEGLADER